MNNTKNQLNPELKQTLSQLKDIQLPTDSLAWPPAPGVLILFIITFILFLLIIKTIINKTYNYYHNRARILALKELASIEKMLLHPSNNTDINYIELIQKIATLLKKCALTKNQYYNNQPVNSLSGEKWLEYLDITAKTDKFSTKDGRILLDLAYQPENLFKKNNNNSEITHKINNLITLTRNWIKINL